MAAMIPKSGRKGTELLAVPGQEVDYYSQTYNCWAPTRISKVDVEKGEIYLECRNSALDRDKFLTRVRQRARPDTADLEWIRDIMNGKMEQESERLFQEYTDITMEFKSEDDVPTLVKVLSVKAMFKVGAWVDEHVGISGTAQELKRKAHADLRRRGVALPPEWKAKQSHAGATYYYRDDTRQTQWDWPGRGNLALVLTKGPFNECFWETLQSVFRKYAVALQRDFAPGARNAGENYMLGQKLGEGAFGTVYVAEHIPTGQRRAVKTIECSLVMGSLDESSSEIERMRTMDHPHVVKLYEHWTDGEFVYLAMDFCSGGDLNHKVRAHKAQGVEIEESIVADLMRQILRAVGHMHSHGVIHLDLKPANIVMTDERGTLPPAKGEPNQKHQKCECLMTDPSRVPHIMVIDFGLAKVFQPWDKHGDRCGSPITMAPEVWSDVVTPAADVFSCGVIMYYLLAFEYPCGVPPFTVAARAFWRQNQKFKPFADIAASDCKASSEAVKCCQSMMTVDRMERPTACVALRHRFLCAAPGDGAGELGIKIEEKVAQRMKKLPGKDALHKSVALRLASDWSANRLGSIKKAFQEVDQEGTGRLTVDQLEEALRLAGVDGQTAREAADAMDLTRNGRVGWSEFVASCLHLGDQNLDDDLKRMFMEADEDGDGKLEKKDLLKMLTSEYLQADGAEELMDKVLHGQQNVDFNAFRSHFVSIMQPGDLDFLRIASRDKTIGTDDGRPTLPGSPRAGRRQRRRKSTSRRPVDARDAE